MKKYIGLLAVALMSSLLTIGGFYYVTRNDAPAQRAAVASPAPRPVFRFTNARATPASFGSAGEGGDMTFVSAASKTVDAVVHINNYSSEDQGSGNPLFDLLYGRVHGAMEPRKSSSGSGVIISADGYIVTNNHVIKGASKVEVTLNNEQTYEAKLVGKDENTDIALLKVKAKGLPFLTLSNSDNLAVGQWVLAVGNPFNLTSTVTAGIISAKGRNINLLSRNGAKNPIESFIQTDAVVNPGNSGGALVNLHGDLIGINSAISSHTGVYEGYSFAIPSNLVKKVVEDILQYGSVRRAFLGLVPIDLKPETIQAFNRQHPGYAIRTQPQDGVYILRLSPRGGAIESGLKVGDVVKQIDGKKIQNTAELRAYIGGKRPGSNVKVRVKRNGKMRTYTVKLTNTRGGTKVLSDAALGIQRIEGAKLRALSNREKWHYGLRSGVYVISVGPGKMAKAGVNAGEVITKINGIPVNKPQDIKRIIQSKPAQVIIKTYDTRGY